MNFGSERIWCRNWKLYVVADADVSRKRTRQTKLSLIGEHADAVSLSPLHIYHAPSADWNG